MMRDLFLGCGTRVFSGRRARHCPLLPVRVRVEESYHGIYLSIRSDVQVRISDAVPAVALAYLACINQQPQSNRPNLDILALLSSFKTPSLDNAVASGSLITRKVTTLPPVGRTVPLLDQRQHLR